MSVPCWAGLPWQDLVPQLYPRLHLVQHGRGRGKIVQQAQAEGVRLHQGEAAHQEGEQDFLKQEVRISVWLVILIRILQVRSD